MAADFDTLAGLLKRRGVTDAGRAVANLRSLRDDLGPDKFGELVKHLPEALAASPDADMSLNNLERFFGRDDARPHFRDLTDTRARHLNTLVQLLGTSQFFSDTLVRRPADLKYAIHPEQNRPSPDALSRLTRQADRCESDADVLRLLRHFRERQLLRIGANDVIRGRPLEETVADLSRVADLAIGTALHAAGRALRERFGEPFTDTGGPARVAVMAFGKLGGEELNYSSDIDLMVVYDQQGQTRGGRTSVPNGEYYGRLVSEVVRLLSAVTEDGQAYRVDLRLRPEGRRGALALSLVATLAYYEKFGRTWERQALIKLRPVAGDPELGAELLNLLEPFIYREYLNVAEINEIKALKRRIEHKASEAGLSGTDVKTGRGGIRDVEFTIQFLQLLNGGQLPGVRRRGTLDALRALEEAGCLTDIEFRSLSESYRFLRRVEHRLQLLFDWQTHKLPDDAAALKKLARRVGYTRLDAPDPDPLPAEGGPRPQSVMPIDEDAERPDPAARILYLEPIDQFFKRLQDSTQLNRRVLEFLLHQCFAGSGQAEPESDLILAVDPPAGAVRDALKRYRFRDPRAAWANLSRLAREDYLFLSTRRCRHFFASVAPALLRAVAATADPDRTLNTLERVTASLGAKSVLWELFSFNEPSLKLYAELCANSEFLSELLITNPGMIDELLDTLLRTPLRSVADLKAELAELCRNADDIQPILHSFQDKELLRIGATDILGEAEVRTTAAALSDLAEAVLGQAAAWQYDAAAKKYGRPELADGRPCRWAWLGLGKFGGRELGYHSDLDAVVVYEGPGRTRPGSPAARQVANVDFFAEVVRKTAAGLGKRGPLGRLYEVDLRLRPEGSAGDLARGLAEFRQYFRAGGPSRLWERQALTRSRPVCGDADFAGLVSDAVGDILYEEPWRDEFRGEITQMRQKLEASTGPRSLKRGPGGLADVEFAAQYLTLKHGRHRPEARRANLWESLEALRDAGLLAQPHYEKLVGGYTFLRLIESRLRLITNRADNELPNDFGKLRRLIHRLGPDGGQFSRRFRSHTTHIRKAYLAVLAD